MSKDSTAPEPNKPAGTEGEPSATPPKEGKESATAEDEIVSIKKSDLIKLQSQRDSNYQENRDTRARVAMIEMDRDIDKFLKENSSKFPDVEIKDLYDAERPEDFEQLALQVQDRVDKAVQRKLAETQNAEPPKMTTEERATLEKKLKKNPGHKSFQAMLSARLPRLN